MADTRKPDITLRSTRGNSTGLWCAAPADTDAHRRIPTGCLRDGCDTGRQGGLLCRCGVLPASGSPAGPDRLLVGYAGNRTRPSRTRLVAEFDRLGHASHARRFRVYALFYRGRTGQQRVRGDLQENAAGAQGPQHPRNCRSVTSGQRPHDKVAARPCHSGRCAPFCTA